MEVEVTVEITSPHGKVTLQVPVGPVQNLDQAATAALQATFDFGTGVVQAARDASSGVKYGP